MLRGTAACSFAADSFPKGACTQRQGLRSRARGKVETQHYDNRVVVILQKKAWVNEEIACAWVLRVFKLFLQSINQREEVCLFLHNLSAQTTARFRLLLRHKCNTKQHLEPAECTHEIAVMDAGVGRMCKNHMHKAYDEWLEGEDNNDRIVKGKVPVSEKRILLTKWLGNAGTTESFIVISTLCFCCASPAACCWCRDPAACF